MLDRLKKYCSDKEREMQKTAASSGGVQHDLTGAILLQRMPS